MPVRVKSNRRLMVMRREEKSPNQAQTFRKQTLTSEITKTYKDHKRIVVHNCVMKPQRYLLYITKFGLLASLLLTFCDFFVHAFGDSGIKACCEISDIRIQLTAGNVHNVLTTVAPYCCHGDESLEKDVHSSCSVNQRRSAITHWPPTNSVPTGR